MSSSRPGGWEGPQGGGDLLGAGEVATAIGPTGSKEGGVAGHGAHASSAADRALFALGLRRVMIAPAAGG